MKFVVYVLLCADGKFYVGHTDNLETRMAHHHNGTFKGWTHNRRPVELVWHEFFQTRDQAFAVERQIKGWSHAKKQALVDRDWESISVLASNRQS
ncbi:MAG: GIY-YIG nuclease family protein [Pseudomonadota bacterium]